MAIITFDDSGLDINSLAEVKTYIEEKYKEKLGATFNIAESSEVGKEIGIQAEIFSQLLESIMGTWLSNNRSTSKGISLDYNLELNGLKRQAASFSTVDIYVRGTSGQAIGAESLKVTVEDTGDIFVNLSTATIGSIGSTAIIGITQSGGTATVTMASNPYTDDSFVFIEGLDQSGYNLLAQITNGTGTTFDYTVDSGTVSPATGTGTVYKGTAVPMTAQISGAIIAPAGTLKNITGTVPGVVRVENADDAALGALAETDPEARTRADESVSVSGGGFREAILAKLRNVVGVTSATVFENNGNTTDVDGRPPGAVECFVLGGTDEAVARGVLDSVSDGVRMYGNVNLVLQDSENQDVNVGFSRLTSIRIYVETTITTNTDILQGDVYPVDGDSQVAAALAAIVFEPGFDVWAGKLQAAINSVPGVISISDLKFDTVTPTVNTETITVTPVTFAKIDSSDVIVTS